VSRAAKLTRRAYSHAQRATASDVEATFKDEDCFVGVLRFDDIEPSGSNRIDCVHADQELILHDQNDRSFFSGLNHRYASEQS
jgi:hypothetical protein